MGWRLWALAASFYGYGFFMRVAPSVMVEDLMRDLAIGAGGVGALSATYFYAYAFAQTPIGAAFDRFGARKVMSAGAALAAIGAAMFAIGGSVWLVGAGRALIGLGVGAGYLGALLTARAWLPPERFGLVTGLTLTVGMIGAIGAQAPLAALVNWVGWRAAMAIAAAAAALLGLALASFLRDAPRRAQAPAEGAAGLSALVRDRRFWPLCVYAGAIGSPILAWAGLWAVPYLRTAHQLDTASAGALASLALIGWAIGGPLAGHVADRLGRGRPVLIAAAGGVALAMASFAFASLPLVLDALALFALGIASGGMVATFALAREAIDPARIGAALGVLNTSVLLMGAVMQNLLGALLDLGWRGEMAAGARVYPIEAFPLALAPLILSGALGVVAASILDERRAASR